jgi:hypothetical protein
VLDTHDFILELSFDADGYDLYLVLLFFAFFCDEDLFYLGLLLFADLYHNLFGAGLQLLLILLL